MTVFCSVCFRVRGTFYVAYDDPDQFCRYGDWRAFFTTGAVDWTRRNILVPITDAHYGATLRGFDRFFSKTIRVARLKLIISYVPRRSGVAKKELECVTKRNAAESRTSHHAFRVISPYFIRPYTRCNALERCCIYVQLILPIGDDNDTFLFICPVERASATRIPRNFSLRGLPNGFQDFENHFYYESFWNRLFSKRKVSLEKRLLFFVFLKNSYLRANVFAGKISNNVPE